MTNLATGTFNKNLELLDLYILLRLSIESKYFHIALRKKKSHEKAKVRPFVVWSHSRHFLYRKIKESLKNLSLNIKSQ